MHHIDYWREDRLVILEHMLSIMERLIDANGQKNVKHEVSKIDQHELFVKNCFHIASIFTLYRGSIISSQNTNKLVFDYSSILILCRSSLENYLTYFLIYHSNKRDDDFIFWYNTWVIDSLYQRQKINAKNDSVILEKQKTEKQQIAQLLIEVKKTANYQERSERWKNQYNSKLEWPRPGWVDIAIKSGIKHENAKSIYGYFSTYAHSTNSSVFQFKSATKSRDGRDIVDAFMNYVFGYTTKYIDLYIKDFNLSNILNNQDKSFIEAWNLLFDSI